MPAERIDPEDYPTESSSDTVNPMAEMLDDYLHCAGLTRGQTLPGTVVRLGNTDVVVDVGAKCEGIVPERDLQRLSPQDRDAIQVGDRVLVYVIDPEDENGNIVLSLSRAQLAQDWHKASQILENQEIVKRPVIGCNKGGVLVQFGRIRGFVPGSHLTSTHAAVQATSAPGEDDRWASLIGETLQLKAIEVDQKRNRLILSERAAMRGQRTKLLRELCEGEVRRGRVINLVDFGAFVDIGGIDGLVHLSELSWKRVSHPQEVIEVGQEIDVYVLRIDQERQRVALSIKRLQPDPWSSIEERYTEGQLVEGVITRLAKWGAFVCITGDEGIEGLIHVSELSDSSIVHPREVVKLDQTVTARVIGLDAQNHKLALSLKQVTEGEFIGEDWRAELAADQTNPSALSVSLSQALEQSDEFS